MNLHARMERLCGKVSEQCTAISEKQAERFVHLLTGSERIFIAGTGRSGLVARAFGMRLMHLGFTVYIVGEVVTPAIRKGDLLLLVSGSGLTASLVAAARTGKAKGAKVVAVTSFPKSPVAANSSHVVQVRGRRMGEVDKDYLNRQLAGRHEPLAPLGTIFELSTAVFFDSVVEELMGRYRKSEKEMRERHTNLE